MRLVLLTEMHDCTETLEIQFIINILAKQTPVIITTSNKVKEAAGDNY